MQLYTISRRARSSSKFIAAILILLLNLTPVSPVFAAFGHRTPTTQEPNVFTDTALPKIDGATGAFTQSIPLDIPPGRNGLQPDVTLDYNSQRTQDSIVGYGWQLSIPYIQRLNKTGSQDLYGNTPYFTSSHRWRAGERLDHGDHLSGNHHAQRSSTRSPRPATRSRRHLRQLLVHTRCPPAARTSSSLVLSCTNGSSTRTGATLNGQSLTIRPHQRHLSIEALLLRRLPRQPDARHLHDELHRARTRRLHASSRCKTRRS